MKKAIAFSLSLLLFLGTVTGCEKESSPVDSPAAKLTTIQQRRETAESYMRDMMSMLWQVSEPITYSYRVSSKGADMDKESYIVHLEPGKIYSGLPYTHGSGDAESFAHFGTKQENGVLLMDSLTQELINGSGGVSKEYNIARIGNDCADAVFAAWTRAGSSVTFDNAANMTPKNGCIPVGNYKTVPEDAESYAITGDICKENGEEVIFKAYTQLQMADALTVNTSGGAHAMLVYQVHTVMDGDQIDPEESYILIHDQTSANYKNGVTRWDESVSQDVYVMGGVERKFTFRKLYKSGYLPVTCKEFLEETPLSVETVTDSEDGLKLDKTTMFAGAFTANYRIADVMIEILDKDGNTVQKAICCAGGGERYIFLLSRFEMELEKRVLAGSIDLTLLEQGKQYTCRFTCRLATGAKLEARTFTFIG